MRYHGSTQPPWSTLTLAHQAPLDNYPATSIYTSFIVFHAFEPPASQPSSIAISCGLPSLLSIFLRLTGVLRPSFRIFIGIRRICCPNGASLLFVLRSNSSLVLGEWTIGVSTATPPSPDPLGSLPSANCICAPVLKEASTPSNDSRYSTRSLASCSCARVKFMLPGSFQLLEFHHDGLQLG
ncbi:unnamed protein product [Somion occarium]|uniref:Uncharacterized protein n=1 Tax=Somion occarium TaxID=3059160 RepID=A0ABP1CUR5_9APHY